MEFNLRPKNIIIAGGGSGIGLSTAEKLAQNGAKNIILASRNLDKLKDAQNHLMEKADHIHILQFGIVLLILTLKEYSFLCAISQIIYIVTWLKGIYV